PRCSSCPRQSRASSMGVSACPGRPSRSWPTASGALVHQTPARRCNPLTEPAGERPTCRSSARGDHDGDCSALHACPYRRRNKVGGNLQRIRRKSTANPDTCHGQKGYNDPHSHTLPPLPGGTTHLGGDLGRKSACPACLTIEKRVSIVG